MDCHRAEARGATVSHSNKFLFQVLTYLLYCRLDIHHQLRRLKDRPSYEEQVALQTKRRRLQVKIDVFESQSSVFLGALGVNPQSIIDDSWFDQDDEDNDSGAGILSSSDIPSTEALSPESITLSLPSSFPAHLKQGRMPYVVKCEVELRKGQANDALHSLRIAIAQKSFVFRTRIRKNAPTTGYTKRLRGYGDARAVQMTIGLAAKIYTTARTAISILAPDSPLLDEYQILTASDLVASTAVADPNARGQSRVKLSWIWRVVSNSDNPEFLDQR